ncbi:MAG: response regulator [Gammaproteobacteria bacterium]|jgi:YesN/AraC family two-component response regulator|nr:response regulator [Gammaproteobacteria bacterium]MBT7307155.1 response regulator [Gammaproteobacteria bacterium]
MSDLPTLLLADDEEPMRMFIVGLLKHEACKVVAVASDGKEAWELYQKHKPDITLLDINMPKMNGVEALRKIREVDSDSFVCMISADTFPEVIREVASLGIGGFVVKPLNHKKLHPIFDKYAKLNR